jgi:cytochrome c
VARKSVALRGAMLLLAAAACTWAQAAPASDGKSVADGKSAPPPPAPPKPLGFDYEAELAFQTGELKGKDLTAFAAHAGVEHGAGSFLASPLKMVPGTAMTYDGVSDAAERADLIAYLREAGNSRECKP